MAIRNIAGEPDGITKDPQCRHNETLFVTYSGAAPDIRAMCSNCGSVTSGDVTKESARNALMRIEAPPLTGGGFTP